MNIFASLIPLTYHLGNTDEKEILEKQSGLVEGWKERLVGAKRQLDFEMIGKVVVSVEKKGKITHSINKKDGSETSSLGPGGVGETQQLMRATDFLDLEAAGDSENGRKSPNLLDTTDDDETVFDEKKQVSKKTDTADDGGAITQRLRQEEEVSLGGTRTENWWATCKFCHQFPCVWTQNEEAVIENDHVLNQIAMLNLPPPSLVRRQRAFIYIATLVWGRQGYAYRFDLDTCVVNGVRKQWPAPTTGNYNGDGVE
jgi:hypothetical protein